MTLPKIAFIRQRFSRFGGGELILDRTISALAARHVPVTLIARSWEARDGVEFIPCDAPAFPRAGRDARFASAACKIVGAMPEALVQSHERLPCCDIYRAGDGVHAAYLRHRSKHLGVLRRLLQSVSRYHHNVLKLEQQLFSSRRLKAVIVNSPMVGEEIAQHFAYPRERIHFIPNGIELSAFDSSRLAAARAQTREQLGIKASRNVLILVGSGYERKGVRSAIEALAKSDTDAMLLVIGHDKHASRYRSLARRAGIGERVLLLGKQENVISYYAAADALILPSIYDPFPSAVLEALAAGLPVITSESCGARDIAGEIDPRLVRDAGDITGLAEAIELALSLSALPEVKTKARAIAARFEMNVMVERMMKLYERLAKEKAPDAHPAH